MLKVVPTNACPEWLDKELWDDYIAYRKELKKPLTAVGEKRAIMKLQRFYEQGQNVNEILEQSITNNWLGLFAVKQKVDTKDENNVLRTGKKMGVEPKPGESSFDYARRVLEAKRL
jgi:hypothetical protein